MSREQETEPLREITLKPIGRVSNSIADRSAIMWDRWEGVESELIIDPDLAEGLDGLEGFSHIIVIFWMHKAPPFSASHLKIHPRGRQELPLTGIFVTRSPTRPNSLGMTTVRLLERRGNVLRVRGLDALDGSPIIDIKAYFPRGGAFPDAKTPRWV